TDTLTECDKHQIVEMDPDLKIYAVRSMDAMYDMNTASTPMGPQNNKSHQDAGSGTGKVISTYTMQDMGTDKILDLDTHHYMMTLHTQMSGCAGNGDADTKMEMWVAPGKGGLDCPERYAAARDVTTESGCKISVEQHGDLDKLADIYRGIVVRQKIYNGDQVIMTMDTREYSTAALDAALFDIPADYKQVSHDDFQKAQSKHMQDAMKHFKPSDNQSNDTPPADTSSTDQGSQNGDQGNNTNNNPNSNPNNGQKKKRGGFHIPNPF
ncbi:MAG TPA: hypothetical protein VFW40_10635, partial [Capsulimonadaceae bacterium]|nr:hypothetical protein [Capsulimonadaceae bacterium]